jgi:hypothetical protein
LVDTQDPQLFNSSIINFDNSKFLVSGSFSDADGWQYLLGQVFWDDADRFDGDELAFGFILEFFFLYEQLVC